MQVLVQRSPDSRGVPVFFIARHCCVVCSRCCSNMERKHLMGSKSPVVLLLCATLFHSAVRPQHDAFVQAFSAAPLQRTRPGSSSTSSRDSRAATSARRSSGSFRLVQQKCHHRRLAGETALNMVGLGRPPLEEVSVLELPALGQGSDSDDVAVVYFTACDLRVHDHDGLVAGAKAARVLPVYVFDDQVGQSCAF